MQTEPIRHEIIKLELKDEIPSDIVTIELHVPKAFRNIIRAIQAQKNLSWAEVFKRIITIACAAVAEDFMEDFRAGKIIGNCAIKSNFKH